jgi:alpha-L-fucosidase
MQKINAAGGNDWFWAPDVGMLMAANGIAQHLKLLEGRWANFLLNCPPNRDGLLDDDIVQILAQVPSVWTPNTARPPLPPQPPQIDTAYDPVGATATSGAASAPNAVDGVDDFYAYTVWQSSGALPQSVTIDLGQVQPDVGILNYVPRYVANVGPSVDGAITSYAVSVSSDGTTFTQVAAGDWPADWTMKTASFPPAAARYVRLDALAVNGTNAAVTEIAVGAAAH